jgi:pilus assembly protein Flp/PilA
MERMKLLPKAAEVVRRETGQGLVEYALILLLVAVVLIATVRSLGQQTDSTYGNINSAVVNAGK